MTVLSDKVVATANVIVDGHAKLLLVLLKWDKAAQTTAANAAAKAATTRQANRSDDFPVELLAAYIEDPPVP